MVHQIVHMLGGDEFNVVYHLDSDKDWLFRSPSGRGGARKQPVKGKEHFDAEEGRIKERTSDTLLWRLHIGP